MESRRHGRRHPGRFQIQVHPTQLDGVRCLEPRVFEDGRGSFFESYNRQVFQELGIVDSFVQENQSLSTVTGTIRGLHFQRPPFAQAKLIRVVAGAVFDVAVDVRHGSPSFGQFAAIELSAENRRQLFVPEGFAHGFITLADDTEVIYLVNRHYDKASEGGLLWNDPALGIRWPMPARGALLNARDDSWPTLAELPADFTFAPPP